MSAYRTATVTFYRNDMGLIDVEVPATNYDAARRIVEEQYGDVDIKRVNLNWWKILFYMVIVAKLLIL